ncbi:hypothetical protein CAEBREN_13807 [Caenorhabditis brenneri]|uniref:BTB domain-containing protein n=1 Tax=Caenorhabditis brenneri TaxID=135651 RepID=G0MUX6_CAEBE|nr:hypothetical protein CAEBREN_13807 [Caenorhabditis brenneri]
MSVESSRKRAGGEKSEEDPPRKIASDECVELALSLADYLESPVLEDICIEFLSKESEYSKEEQFALGDKHNSMKLITQLCSDVKDSYELHEIVPVDINSLKSSTKTIVLQKSFELLGHRKPPAPPLSQQKETVFESMVEDFIDQAAVVNHHGRILAEQAFLLDQHVFMNDLITDAPQLIKELIEQDSRIPILANQFQKAVNQIEKNAIQAQNQVIHRKNYIMCLEISLANHQDLRAGSERFINILLESLKNFPYLISRGKRTENIALRNHEAGEKTIDVQYRNITREFEERGLPEGELSHQKSWLQLLTNLKDHSVKYFSRNIHNVQLPDGLRQIPREINFGLLGEFVSNVRQYFYNIRLQPAVIPARNEPAQAAPHPEGEHQNDGDGLNEDSIRLNFRQGSGEPTRKRAGREEPGEDPPRKIASGQLDETDSNQKDVVIIVEGQKFSCKKEELSRTSKYFEKMFNLKGLPRRMDSNGTIEMALSLADYLESPVLEERCIEFLSLESEYSKEEQFALGDKHNSMRLITQICSDIKDSYELHEIVPVDINSLKSNTKTIVLQKSFELLGHRTPPAPSLPQQKEALFETMVDDFIDQAAVVNHHGRILAEQAFLLDQHVFMDDSITDAPRLIKELIEQDSRIPILTS